MYGKFQMIAGGLHEYGSFEVFHSDDYGSVSLEHGPGWYWWPCFPGCLPDGEPVGPFNSKDEAYENARIPSAYNDDA